MTDEHLADSLHARDRLIVELRAQLAAKNEEIDRLRASRRSQENEQLLPGWRSEERFEAFVTACSDVVYIMSPDWTRMHQLRGRDFLPDTDTSSSTWLETYIPSEDQPQVLAVIEQAIRTKSVFELEHRVKRVDGTYGWTSSRAIPLLDAAGEIREWIGAAKDITERKQVEETLRQSLLTVEAVNAELRESRRAALGFMQEADAARHLAEATRATLALADWRMQQALLAGHSFTFDWDPVTDQVQRSDSCAPILGLAGEAVICDTGGNFHQRVHPDDRDRFVRVFDTLTPENARYAIEYRVVRGDGSIIVLEECGEGRFDAQGRLDRVFGAATDISKRKQAEMELRRSEARYRLLHESLRDGFVQVTMEGRILDCNEVYYRMLGYSAEELSRLTYIQITPERWHDIEAAIVRDQIVPRGYSDLYEKEYRRKDGTVFPVELRSILIRDDEGQPHSMWAIVRDITERKKSEEELKKLNEELERRVEFRTQELQETQARLLHVEKLSAIGKLSASIAHEFNSPLQTVMTVLKGLRLNGQLDDGERKLLEAAIGESERMKSLIRNLQDFYRPSSGRKVLMNLHATIDSLLLLHKSDFNRKNIRIELHYQKRLPHIMAIPDQIKQVFLNLLNNAAEACLNRGGVITISTWKEGGMVAVAIRDTGVGIESSDMEHIFRPFFSTKAEVKGTGLGLSISYGIVSNHRGEIRVESQPGEGATFTILLPIDEL